jgi:hypothetical protein
VPEAAPWPRISADGRTYTFVVRPRFTRFSNGETVGPRHFLHVIERVADRRLGSLGAKALVDVVGAKAKMDGKATSIRGLRVRGATLSIRLRRPAYDLLARLALPYFCALSRRQVFRPGELPAVVHAAGPYFVARRTRDELVLERNPFYRGPRRRNADRIEYALTRFDRDAFDRVEAGRTDWLPSAVVPDGRTVERSQLRRIPLPAVRALIFGTSPGQAFSNIRLRRAAALAVDRAGTARGVGLPSDALVTPFSGYRRGRVYPARPTRDSLTRARSFARGLTPVRVYGRGSVYPNERAFHESLGAIGIRSGMRRSADCDQRADMYVLTLPSLYHDPASVLRLLADPDEGCYWPAAFDTSWRSRLDRAVRRRGAARLRALARIEKYLLYDAVLAVGLYRPHSTHLFSARVGCLHAHRVYQIDLGALCLR